MCHTFGLRALDHDPFASADSKPAVGRDSHRADGHWKRLLSGGHLWKGFGPGLCEPGNGECLRPLTNTGNLETLQTFRTVLFVDANWQDLDCLIVSNWCCVFFHTLGVFRTSLRPPGPSLRDHFGVPGSWSECGFPHLKTTSLRLQMGL